MPVPPTAPTAPHGVEQPAVRRPAARARRSTGRRVATALPALVLAAALAACGQDGAAGGSPTTVGPTDGPTAPVETPVPTPSVQESAAPESTATAPGVPADFTAELIVDVEDGAGSSQGYEVFCDGTTATGTAPDPAGACEAVAAAGGVDAFAELDGDVMCTQVFGGPQTAVVSGEVGEEPVSADLSRADGCQIERWDALVPLLPAVDA